MNDRFSAKEQPDEGEVLNLVSKQQKMRRFKSTVLWIMIGGALAVYLLLGVYYIWFRFFWQPDVDKALEKLFESTDSLKSGQTPHTQP